MDNCIKERYFGNSLSSPEVSLITCSRHAMKNNNYLIVNPVNKEAVLLDPAWQIDKIQSALRENEVTLSGILLTHSHFDHTDLARPLAEIYDCPIWMSAQEVAFSGFQARQLHVIDGSRPWIAAGMKITPILTPGHTPGCVCYLIDDNLFTGDVLFVEGCGICPDIEAAYQMYDSLSVLKYSLPAQTKIFPGHTYVREPGLQLVEVLKYNMYLHFTDPYSFAGFRMRKGQSMQKIMDFR